MPRDVNGNYTLPAGNPVVTATVISSTWANTTLSDLSTAMSNSLDRTGASAGMTGQFKATSGSIGAPGISFGAELTSGLYRAAAGDFRFSVSSTDIFKFAFANPTGTIGLAAVNGTSINPMRSDASQALSQAIVPTWTGAHTFSALATFNLGIKVTTAPVISTGDTTTPSTALTAALLGAQGGTIPMLTFVNSAAAADAKIWRTYVTGLTYNIDAVNDAYGVTRSLFSATRSGNAIASVNWGNATDNPTYDFLGSGLVSARDQAGTAFNLGWRDMPVNIQSTNYSFVLSDRGKLISDNSGTNTYTIPANASVAFPIGSTIAIFNGSGANLTINITTDTLFFIGSGATGSRTLANAGYAVIVKYAATSWFITGTGVT